MKEVLEDVLTAFCTGILLPGFLLNSAAAFLPEPTEETVPETVAAQEEQTMICIRRGQTLEQMGLEAYVADVVLAEMPASFEPEALKAQSVAARTYAVKAALTGGKHGDGSICTEASCCQGCVRQETVADEETVEKIRQAVRETAGMVLTWEGEPIEAAYFSCSGGQTEDAVAVWGTEYPYLRSVSSPGEEQAEVYSQTLEFTPEAFCKALGRELIGNPETWFTIVTYTEGGGVAAMTVGGEVYSGTRLRSLLGLRSTAFSVAALPDRITVTTRGYGHRVGMSQYGAEAMAVAGHTFREILAHYYPGTALEKWYFEAPA